MSLSTSAHTIYLTFTHVHTHPNPHTLTHPYQKQIRELTTRCQKLREAAAAGSAAAAEEGRQAAALDTRQAQLVARCEDLARRIRWVRGIGLD